MNRKFTLLLMVAFGISTGLAATAARAETATLNCPGGITTGYVIKKNNLVPWTMQCTGENKRTASIHYLYTRSKPNLEASSTVSYSLDELKAKLKAWHALK
jgi:hypothetical protein